MPTDPKTTSAERRLEAAEATARRKRLGKPLPGGERDLAKAAEVGPADAPLAAWTWDRLAPPAARGLLEAR